MKRFQVTISTLLLITLLSALAVATWVNRPKGLVELQIEKDGSIQLDGFPVRAVNLHRRLNAKVRWHRIWALECELNVSRGEFTPESFVSDIVDDGSLPEFDSITYTQTYTVTVPNLDE